MSRIDSVSEANGQMDGSRAKRGIIHGAALCLPALLFDQAEIGSPE